MRRLFLLMTVLFISSSLLTSTSFAGFSKNFCNSDPYFCYKVKKGETWKKLFPDEETRSIVKKINRMNIAVEPGTTIAIPKDIKADEEDESGLLNYSPLPKQIPAPGYELINVQLGQLAWGAYSPEGELLKWGPISGGKNCNKNTKGCMTITGTYTFYRKQGSGCISSKYPLPRGGAPMPYCMHFKGGYAIHGSPTVPGYHASHGCVRLFTDDAKWLNQEFVDTGSTRIRILP